MGTNYPGGIDSYTTKQDGVDTVAASHVNNLQDAVVAIETELGTNPKGSFSNVGAAIAAKLSTTGGTLTGNVSCSAGVTIDGVDVSSHTHTGTGDGGAAIPVLVGAQENESTILSNLARRQSDWVHNSVNSSSVGGGGIPNYISVGSGLSVNVNGAATPIKMDIAGYYQHITTNTSISGLTAESTCYLFAEKAASGFTPTLGHTTLAPVYAYVEPEAPSADQHWYDLCLGKMKRWTGSVWEEKQRIFIGECDTGIDSVIEVENYILKGRYDSGWQAVSANTKYEVDHMIGCIPLEITLLGATSEDGENCRRVVYFDDGSNTYGGMVWDIGNLSLVINDDTSGFDYPIRYGASTSATSGYYRVIAKRGF